MNIKIIIFFGVYAALSSLALILRILVPIDQLLPSQRDYSLVLLGPINAFFMDPKGPRGDIFFIQSFILLALAWMTFHFKNKKFIFLFVIIFWLICGYYPYLCQLS